jgi:hypothetical protein
MRGSLAIGAIFLALTSTADAEQVCSLRFHAQCSGSNDLISANGTTVAVRSFLRQQPRERREILANLGETDERRFLRDGLDMFIGCRPHDCGDKSALVLSANGKILAAALLFYRVADKPQLEIFIKAGAPKDYIASEIKNTLNEGFAIETLGLLQTRIVIEQVDVRIIP